MSGHLSCFDIFLLVAVPIVVTANIVLSCCIGIVLPKHMKEMGWYYIGNLGEMSQETKMDFCSCDKGIHRDSYPPSGGQTTSGPMKTQKPTDKTKTTSTTVRATLSEATTIKEITTESTEAMYPHSKSGKLITSVASHIAETNTVSHRTRTPETMRSSNIPTTIPKILTTGRKIKPTSSKITTRKQKTPTTNEIFSTTTSLDYSLSNTHSTKIHSSKLMQTSSSTHGSTSHIDSTGGESTSSLKTKDTTVRTRPSKGFFAKIDV